MYILRFLLALTLFYTPLCYAVDNEFFGKQICDSQGFNCLTVKAGESWESLWPNRDMRDLIKRINRTNMKLKAGMTLAVPHDFDISIWDISPFPKKIKSSGKKTIIVDQNKLAWGAYDPNGELQWWGPISSGKNYCKDVRRKCTTVTGIYYTFDKKGSDCESRTFPVDDGGGAKMPFCMFFYRGYALHGSDELPGYRDSHGCIRLFSEDAKWLNENFVEIPSQENDFQGTKIIIPEVVEST